MIRIEHVVLGMCATNCYVIFDGGAKTQAGFWDDGAVKEGIIVDPAADVYAIKDMLGRYNVKPVAILLTHGHFDHILAVDKLRAEYGIKVYAHEAEAQILENAGMNLSLPFTGSPMTTKADVYLRDGELIKLAGYDIKVINVPGHTVGGVCYYFEKERVLISGDTLFNESVGRSDFPTGNGGLLIRSIKEKLFTLPDDVKVYPGHNGATTIAFEKNNNPFLV